MCATLLIATLPTYRLPRRNRESEMVVFGDGGGFVRLYEVRVNPLVRVVPAVLAPSAARLPASLRRGSTRGGDRGLVYLGFTLSLSYDSMSRRIRTAMTATWMSSSGSTSTIAIG